MSYDEWKRIIEPLSIFTAGAIAFGSFQKLYRNFMGLPPCGEVDKLILDLRARIARFDRLCDQFEKATKPSQEK